MAEKEQLAQELMKISMEKNGELTAEKEKKIREFAESFLLLLDDTEE